jgi:hypothetical protein
MYVFARAHLVLSSSSSFVVSPTLRLTLRCNAAKLDLPSTWLGCVGVDVDADAVVVEVVAEVVAAVLVIECLGVILGAGLGCGGGCCGAPSCTKPTSTSSSPRGLVSASFPCQS